MELPMAWAYSLVNTGRVSLVRQGDLQQMLPARVLRRVRFCIGLHHSRVKAADDIHGWGIGGSVARDSKDPGDSSDECSSPG